MTLRIILKPDQMTELETALDNTPDLRDVLPMLQGFFTRADVAEHLTAQGFIPEIVAVATFAVIVDSLRERMLNDCARN